MSEVNFMRILAALTLALFCVPSLPAAVLAPRTSLQIKSFGNGKKPHKVLRHRGRKHRRS